MKHLLLFLSFSFLLLTFTCVTSAVKRPEDPPQEIGGANSAGPALSSFTPLIEGDDAFHARLVLAKSARQSLDVQYYIWHRDKTGSALIAALADAAERGVRVRLLLDDVNLGEERDFLEAIDLHPNIEVRLFNPARSDAKGLSNISRGLEYASNFEVMNRRMHNKVFIADRHWAVVGGRNIGDEYFDLNDEKNFRDLDLLAAGPAGEELSRAFDDYWKSPLAFAIQSPDRPTVTRGEAEWRKIRAALAIDSDALSRALFQGSARKNRLPSLDDYKKRMIRALAEAVYDSPAVLQGKEAQELEEQLSDWPEAQEELLIESAYFIPSDTIMDSFERLKARGVRIRILTNSSQSNDVFLAHAGYAAKREKILRLGAELYEWRDGGIPRKSRSGAYASRAGLHSKAFVVDQLYVFIGSMNLDPRSLKLNTESGIMVKSKELAAEVTDFIETGMQADSSWKVTLDAGELQWQGEKAGRDVEVEDEPNTSLWQRFIAKILGWMPIEDNL